MVSSPFTPSVSAEIWKRFGAYRAFSLVVRGVEPDAAIALPVITVPGWAEAHISAWHQAFRGFGANPKRTPPSVDSLLRRFRRDNGLPSIHPVVDLYNAISLNWGVPAGGEDIANYQGSPRLVVADGSESFETTRDGQLVVENVEPGEVIWRDDTGATCRRWNWRQCRRTAIRNTTVDYWFVLDSLPPMGLEDLQRAGDSLITALQQASPNCTVDWQLLTPPARPST